MKSMTDIEKFYRRRNHRLKKRGKAVHFDYQKKSSEYDWITINGQHTPIDDKGIIAGGKFSGTVYSGNKMQRSKKRAASIRGGRVKKNLAVHNKRKHSFCNGTSVGGIDRPATVHPTKYGIDIIHPKDIDNTQQHVSVKQIEKCLERIPAAILKCSPKEIQLLDYKNPRDEHWEQAYNIPGFKSFATGGTANIAVYNNWFGYDDDTILSTMSHEMGHNFDRKINKMLGGNGEFFSDSKEWTDAIESDYKGITYSSTGKWVSYYAHESQNQHEDFADSIKQYVMARKDFKERFPHRAEIIERMLDQL